MAEKMPDCFGSSPLVAPLEDDEGLLPARSKSRTRFLLELIILSSESSGLRDFPSKLSRWPDFNPRPRAIVCSPRRVSRNGYYECVTIARSEERRVGKEC